MDEIKATFFEECSELMEQLESGLLAMQSDGHDPDTVDAVFRAVHSIKGGAGAFDLGHLVDFAHEFETVLDGVRNGRLTPTPEVIATLLRASDRLGDLVQLAHRGETGAPPEMQDLTALVNHLASAPTATSAVDEFDLGTGFVPTPIEIDLTDDDQAPSDTEADFEVFETDDQTRGAHSTGWVIGFDPLPDLLDSGNEPLFLFRALQVLGPVSTIANEDDMPTLENMDIRVARLRWRLLLKPTAADLTETEIESVFEFADNLCVLTIDRATANDLAEFDARAPATERRVPPEVDALPIAPVAKIATVTAVSNSSDGPVKPALATTIRVDLERIDRLVNLVGELVISQSMLAQSILRDGLDTNSESSSGLDDLQQLTRDIQDSVMAIRAQPVRSLFQRMTRIVREAAQMTGKDVQLRTTGEATEIDKTVVERLADPLTHMIRNAIDHGLEDPAERAETAKDATGVVHLSARQQSDRVVIEISDDGRGIDRERVLARAVDRGLVAKDAVLSPAEIDRLLFMPGFSTAENVSALSGRGVGMDVVQRAIRDLNGTISIASSPGEGCTISVSLPLTLAILDGMIVRTSRQRMVIPLSAIIETQTVAAARIEHLGAGRSVVQLHDRFVPIVDLATGMGFSHTPASPDDTEDDSALLFVEPDDAGPFAVQVDAIEAQRQVVIKGLGDSFGRIPCVSAATILGDGQVALIVDPGGLASTSGIAAGTAHAHQEACLQ